MQKEMISLDLFKYLSEEDQMIEKKLQDLVDRFEEQTREHIFDAVKMLCDEIKGNVEKKDVLVISQLKDTEEEAQIKVQAKNDRQALVDEIESLVMVHVDEPGFRDLLHSLLIRFRTHLELWNHIAKQLKEILSASDKNRLESNFKNFSHGMTGFNVLMAESPAAEGSPTKQKASS